MASGKSSVANLLLEELPNGRKLTLAGPIKDIIAGLDKVPDDKLVMDYILKYYRPEHMDRKTFFRAFKSILNEVREIPLETPKPRKRLQYLGTDGARVQIDDQIWIRIALEKASRFPEVDWVIDDLRFVNEYVEFHSAGFIPILLEVDPVVQHKRLVDTYGEYDPSILRHPSETQIDMLPVPGRNKFDSNLLLHETYNLVKGFLWKS